MILECREIYKKFDNGVIANDNINFIVDSGEIHALLGENGAGKTTLMKIIAGELSCDSGFIVLNEKKIENKLDLFANIGMIHQHFELINEFDIAENILLGNMPVKKRFIVDKIRMYELIDRLLKTHDIYLNSHDKISDLSLADRCKVEIAKALYKGVQILIFDEPTASFNENEKKELFKQFKRLSNKGLSIIFITHKLEEVMQIADKITIIESGTNKATFMTASKNIDEISQLLFGKINFDVQREIIEEKKEIIKIDNLPVNSGEITTLIGLDKNGYGEIIARIFEKCSEKKLKISYIPENRLSDGLVKEMSVEENLVNLKNSSKFGKWIFNKRILKSYFNEQVILYDIKIKGSKQKIDELSGGNMQKVLIARELSYVSDIVLAVYPDRGLDKKTSLFIMDKLIEKANENTAVILITPNIDDAINISDKICVLLDHKINYIIENPSKNDIAKIKEKMIRK